MDYIFKEGDKDVKIPLERWVWGAVYKDGSELRQFADDGTFHRVGEIDQENLQMMVLYKPDDMAKRIDIPWSEGMRLIHKYRNIVFDYMGESKREVRVYMFGFKSGGETSVMFILPDDRVVFSNDLDYDVTKHEI